MRQAILIAALWITACAPGRGFNATPAARAEAAGVEGPLLTTPRWVPTFSSSSSSPVRLRSADTASAARRQIVEGIRTEREAAGTLLSAAQRFRTPPRIAFEVPKRLGGGFLFVTGGSIERSESWLSDTAPLFTGVTTIDTLEVGLDRIFVRFNDATREGIDPRSGERIGLGAFPSAPTITQFAAADSWRAIALADLLGPVATFDAGSTWTPIDLPLPISEISASDGVLRAEVGGSGPARAIYEVRSAGQIVRVPNASDTPKRDPETSPWLARAIESGWPLRDGTALLLYEGALVNIDLTTGLVHHRTADALPKRDAKCHALPMGAPGGFGFVCAEDGVKSAIYSFDPGRGALQRERLWPEPRAIVSSGNGMLVIKGGCAEEASGRANDLICVRDRAGAFRDVRISDSARSNVVALTDGRVVAFDPPSGGRSGRLRIVHRGSSSTVPVDLSLVPHTQERALRLGIWLDGFEERRANVLGGWINVGATMIGVEVHLDGSIVFGLPLEVGDVFVASRYGIANGFETTDGGMSWKAIDSPPSPARTDSPFVRAIGPIGAVRRDWVRIGWGESSNVAPPKTIAAQSIELARGRNALVCKAEVAKKKRGDKSFDAPPVALVPSIDKDDDLIILQTDGRTGMIDGSKTGTARVLTWRKKNGDSLTPAKWIVQWEASGQSGPHLSTASPLPRSLADGLVQRWGAISPASMMRVAVFPGDDDAHALLSIFLYATHKQLLFELERGSPPTEISRPDASQDISAATRLFDQWYFASTNATSTQIWRGDSPEAVLLTEVPRTTTEFVQSRAALGADPATRSIVLLVDGARNSPAGAPSLWGLPIAIDNGRTSTPFVVENADSASHPWTPCDRESGFVATVAWPSPAKMVVGGNESWLVTTSARVKIGNGSACLLELIGRPTQGGTPSAAVSSASSANSIRLPLHLIENGKRAHFDCAVTH